MWTVVNPAFHGHQDGWWKLRQDQTLSIGRVKIEMAGLVGTPGMHRGRLLGMWEGRSCNADTLCLFLGLMFCLGRTHVCTAREWVRVRKRKRKRAGGTKAVHETLSRMGSVERKILKSIPGVWGRSLTPARMRTNSSCMAMMMIWVSHSAWNWNRGSRAGWGGWVDRHAYVNMGFADLWISNNGAMSSWAIEVRS